MPFTAIQTSRLELIPFDDSHFEGLFAMNANPTVMRYVTGKPETPEETRAGIARVKKRWEEHGFSWWTIVETQTQEIIGACCVQYLGHEVGNPIEIGWRLREDKWGQGFGSEAARACAEFAFTELNAPEVLAICDPDNIASSNIMKKLGMQFRAIENWHDMDVEVYAISKDTWLNGVGAQSHIRSMSIVSRSE